MEKRPRADFSARRALRTSYVNTFVTTPEPTVRAFAIGNAEHRHLQGDSGRPTGVPSLAAPLAKSRAASVGRRDVSRAEEDASSWG